MKHRGALVVALSLLGAAGIVEAGNGPKLPYCTDRCAMWRPCNKLCREADERVTTCGEYGVCKPPDPIIEEEAPPPPCPNNAPRCEREGRSYCPALPGFTIQAVTTRGLRVRFERRLEGVLKDSSIEWKFENEEAKGPMVMHEFAAPGRYPVTLTVTEAVCNTTQSRTVPIDVPPRLDVLPLMPN